MASQLLRCENLCFKSYEKYTETSELYKVAGLGSRFHDAYGALEALRLRHLSQNIWQIGFSLAGNLRSALALTPF